MNVVIFTDAHGTDVAEELLPLDRGDAIAAYDRFCQPGNAPAGSVVARFYENGQVRKQTPVIAAAPAPAPVPAPEPVVEDVVVASAPAKKKKT